MQTRPLRPQIIAGRNHLVSLVAKLVARNRLDPSQVLYRRDCHRWPFQAPAAIRYQNAGGEPVAVEAVIEDLSAAGIGLAARQPLPDNIVAEVFVPVENRVYSARIRVVRSAAAPEGFRIGCEFVIHDETE